MPASPDDPFNLFGETEEPTFGGMSDPMGNIARTALSNYGNYRNLVKMPRPQNRPISKVIARNLQFPEESTGFKLGQRLLSGKQATDRENINTILQRSGLGDSPSGVGFKLLEKLQRSGDTAYGDLALGSAKNAESAAREWESTLQNNFQTELSKALGQEELAKNREIQREAIDAYRQKGFAEGAGKLTSQALGPLLEWLFRQDQNAGPGGGNPIVDAIKQGGPTAARIIQSLFGGDGELTPDALQFLGSEAANPEFGFPGGGGGGGDPFDLFGSGEGDFGDFFTNFSSPGAEAASVGGGSAALSADATDFLGSLAANPEWGFPAAEGLFGALPGLGIGGAFLGLGMGLKNLLQKDQGALWDKKAQGWIRAAEEESRRDPAGFVKKLGNFDQSVMMSRQAQGIDDNQLIMSHAQASAIQQDLAVKAYNGQLTGNVIADAYGFDEGRRGTLFNNIAQWQKGPDDKLTPVELWQLANGLHGEEGSIPRLLIDTEGMNAQRLEGAPEGATSKDEQGYWRNAEGLAWSDEEGSPNPGTAGRWM